jgi:hypothetical protein
MELVQNNKKYWKKVQEQLKNKIEGKTKIGRRSTEPDSKKVSAISLTSAPCATRTTTFISTTSKKTHNPIPI